MELKNLGINVNKNCNLNCLDCLCGKAVDETISDMVLDNLFHDVSAIENLYLTGGEPLMVPSIVKNVSDKLKHNKVDFKTISITTNGTFFDDDVKEALLSFEPAKLKINVSYDGFHFKAIREKILDPNLSVKEAKRICDHRLEEIYNFAENNGISFSLAKLPAISNMGRAKDLPDKIEKINTYNEFTALGYYDISNNYYNGEIIIDTSGEILSCDYENSKVMELSIGNILNDSLENILYKRCVCELIRHGYTCYGDDVKIKNYINIFYKNNRN